MPFLRDLWNFDLTKSPALFYDSFSSLNDFFDTTDITPENLANLQRKTLISAYGKKGESYDKLNAFLKDMLGEKQGTDDDLFAKLVNGINDGWNGIKHPNNRREGWTIEGYENELDEILKEIEIMANSISNTNSTIPAPSLDPVKKAVKSGNFYKFISAKGKYLEDLGAWIMEKAGLTGLSTGSWQAIDNFFGESQQTSLIEDAMGLLLQGSEKWENRNNSKSFLQVQIKHYSDFDKAKQKREDKKLQKWVNSIKELNGLQVSNGKVVIGTDISSAEEFNNLISLIQNNPAAGLKLSVSLGEDLYERIRNLSINIQAKSNVERHLANKGNRSLYKMDEQKNKYYRQLKAFSKTDPVKDETAVSEKEQNTQYEVFAAYVNYNLSKNIDKTVYGRNEFYLTLEGFADLATLMQQRGFYIRIKDIALSYKEFLRNKFITIYS